ncbi:unnamed protein product, partial [Brugia timori]|uniref:Mg_chelatase domain-containing protein n=1 Tax=Brugia timori TaxID=42155 RepID=A0A0R3QB49_9BILA
MVDNYRWWFSAEIYKTFLKCSADIIKQEGGVVTAYDGDRVMAVYTGDSKNSSAALTALKINHCVSQIIQPAIDHQYPNTEFKLNHVVGIDSSQLRAARIGVRGDNDIVWVGRAANYAAKLTSMPGKPTRITEAVYKRLRKDLKETDGTSMWNAEYWDEKSMVARYQRKLSGPLLDRIDLHIEVPAISAPQLLDAPAGETTAAIRARVVAARER